MNNLRNPECQNLVLRTRVHFPKAEVDSTENKGYECHPTKQGVNGSSANLGVVIAPLSV